MFRAKPKYRCFWTKKEEKKKKKFFNQKLFTKGNKSIHYRRTSEGKRKYKIKMRHRKSC